MLLHIFLNEIQFFRMFNSKTIIKILRSLLLICFVIVSSACSEKTGKNVSEIATSPDETFTNPIMRGADPWVITKDGFYYFIESRGGDIHVSKSDKLTEPSNWKQIWTAPDEGWNQASIWAPELHYIDGKWYVYYAAGKEPSAPYIHQRSGVLESVSQDPQGKYIDKGMLYTGDDIQNKTNNIWAIDLSVFELDEKLYAVWSGKEANRPTTEAPQNLYIAEMENPWTLGSERVLISEPDQEWEIGIKHDINEGPEVLKHNDEIFIIYSARESWLKHYKLGMLKLKNAKSDPLNPDNWTKSGPVFKSTDEVFGPGHASFTRSPDGTEYWIIYHAKKDSTPGWGNRNVNMKRFTWNDDGTPDFGKPTSPDTGLPLPSGQ